MLVVRSSCFYDKADRVTAAVDVGTNGGTAGTALTAAAALTRIDR
jgi:hypothetical protein